MSATSTIEWTDATWNPVRGCLKLSPGCKHCYAETFAERWRGIPGHPYELGFTPRLVPSKLSEPLRWRHSKMVFVNSMSDLFQDSVPDAYIIAVAKVMQLADWHTFQVLTKRADRMRRLLSTKLRFASTLPNIWWGVSVEDKRFGVPRIAHLQAAPASVRFLSIEPLLEDPGLLDLTGLGWVILGGESGPGARPMEESWALSLRDQCARARVPFFFKQWGGVQKSKRGRELAGKTHDAMPAIPAPSEPLEADRLSRLAQAEKLAEQFGAADAPTPLAALRVRHA